MKEILAASFFTTLDEPLANNEFVSNKEFYVILGMIFGMLAMFGAAVHIF